MVDPQRRLLLVDDNSAFVDNLAEIFGDQGYQVERAGSCAEAGRADGFDVALVDVMLPDGDGTKLAADLKERVPGGEVILLTGHASTESAAAAVRAGAFAYLVKPAATADLLLSVEQAMRQVRLGEEKHELSRRAQRAEKLAAVGTLAAGLSHEIRNPLNAAALQLTVLERRLKKVAGLPESIWEPLSLVQSEIARLNKVLEEFLQFARPRELAFAPVDVGAMVDAVVDLLEPQAAHANVRLERAGTPPPSIVGDAGQLQRALLNLALNAIQAAQAGGWVRVETDATPAETVITVSDSGPGVPEPLRERIFEPFFTTKEGGSGLGLPLVHSIVQQHGGTLSLEGASRFVLRLPRR
jgi:two-component system, NtrC family, sensor histidine kinase HydH